MILRSFVVIPTLYFYRNKCSPKSVTCPPTDQKPLTESPELTTDNTCAYSDMEDDPEFSEVDAHAQIEDNDDTTAAEEAGRRMYYLQEEFKVFGNSLTAFHQSSEFWKHSPSSLEGLLERLRLEFSVCIRI